jgi:hypothetical protein
MRPAQGGQFELRLEHSDSERVRYSLALATPEGEWLGSAVIKREGGAVDMQLASDAPGWLGEAARAALRTVWRERQRPDAPPWPRRLTRWRHYRG